jgi:hypothetical protein
MASTTTNSGPPLVSTSEIVELPIWWENQNIPTQLIRELRRRNASNNIGFNFPTPGNPGAVVNNFKDNHGKYRGPMTPWVRVFSNGTGVSPNKNIPQSKILLKNGKEVVYDGFIMMPGQGFYDAFGYKQQGNVLKQDKAIIGYQANGQPHYIDTEYRSQYAYRWPSEQGQTTEVPSILPPPSIDSVSIDITKGLMATGKIDFTCYSLAQLEYLSPFFLTPRINVFIEIGWNLFNIQSLIELHDKQKCWNIIQSPSEVVDRWLTSYGNYGCITGIIKGYDYTTDNGQIFKCKCEILSRQAFYEGVPVENNVSVTTSETETKDKQKVPSETKEYTGLKTVIKTKFPDLRQIVIERKNFGNFVTTGNFRDFYGGKPENRVFIGRSRSNDVYKKASVPNGSDKSDKISYGKSKEFDVVSYLDKKDFDYDANEKVWVQMDFLFEVINKVCSNEKNKTFYIDPNIIVSGHPNLISCDPDVLIPNAVAPKLNIGQVQNGYLPEKSGDAEKNPYLKSKYDDNITSNAHELFIAATRTKTVFKTPGAYRDNLDVVINRLYYDIGGSDNKNLDAAFPFKVDTKHKIDGKDIVPPPGQERKESYEKTYKKYRYGNFKYIYISVSKLMEIAKNDQVITLQQFVNAVLSTLNDAVGGFWKFEVSTADSGGLRIVDNNLTFLGDMTKDVLQKIYVFDLGGANSCIRSVNISTSLTKEQGVLTIYQAGSNKPADSKSDMTQPGGANTPELTYSDRLDQFQVDENKNGQNNEPPSQTELTEDKNDLIAQTQTYGANKNVLNFTCAYTTGGDANNADKNFKQLNLSPDLKNKLEQILDDGDINNLPLYSGISPNFTITVTFDGIFGMRMFQCFAISNLPKPYVPENAIFQITQVTHNIPPGGTNWETVVTALVKCVSGQKIELVHV